MPCILVIDDDEQFLGMMDTMLKLGGYEVLVARDGREGIRICEKTHLDLVITDVIMPEMDGLEVIMELKRRFSGVKIVAVSGVGGRNGPGRYLEIATFFGAHSTLTKPFSQEKLLKTVKELVG